MNIKRSVWTIAGEVGGRELPVEWSFWLLAFPPVALPAGRPLGLLTPDETTASGRVTRRASSDPACLLRVFLLAMAFGE
jgi:hypothetical protein